METARPNSSGRDRKTTRRTGQQLGRIALDPSRLLGARHWSASRARRVVVGGVAIAGALVLAGCDSVSGIPGDEPAPAAVTTPPAAVPTIHATSAAPAPSAAAPSTGVVAELPAAVQRWANDLKTSTIAQLQAKCWTIAPKNVSDMYSDEQPILAALAQPGTATEDAVTWKTRTTTVAVERAALDTGYACPRVASAGADIEYNDADARHTVRRYLARVVGTPLDTADKDGTYPLVCKAAPATWDPTGTGKAIAAPLANNPGKLTGVTKFADQEISSETLRGDYLAVEVPVTNSVGVTKSRTFTLVAGEQGYCIGDVSP